MAIYHLHVGIVSRKTGRSSVAAAAYRSAEKLHSERDGLTHDCTERSSVNAAAYRSGERLTDKQGKIFDFTNKRGVVYSEILLPENAPRYYLNRATLWNAVEKAEKRWDAQTARDIDVALPIEFDRQEQIEIMREYIQENFVNQGMIADFAIHDKGDGNPHAHILLTTRDVTGEGFGNKNRDWNSKKLLKSWRKNWAKICNDKLIEKGLDERIDHRTLKEQGIDREPTIHIGVTAKHMRNSDRMKECNEIVLQNEDLSPEATAEYIHELKQGYIILDKEIAALNIETDGIQQEINSMRIKSEKIEERAERIRILRERIEILKAQRQEMGIFTSKKAINEQIQSLEHSHEQAENYFKQSYYINPEDSAAEVERLEQQMNSKKHFQERLQDKLTQFIAEKEEFKFEYHYQKLLTEIDPDGQRVQDILKQLIKESRSQVISVKDDLARRKSERTLDTLTTQNFQEVLKKLRPDQAKVLMERREHEKEREHYLTR